MGLQQKSTAGGWIFAFAACLVMLGIFAVARNYILPHPHKKSARVDKGKRKRHRHHRRRHHRRHHHHHHRKGAKGAASDEDDFDDYDWSQDYVADNSELGDITDEPDPQQDDEQEAPTPEPPYIPPPDVYQPKGSYHPVAKYSDGSRLPTTVRMDLGSHGSSAPLDEAAVESVLDDDKLMPCYDAWVQKVPQMKGRVRMKFAVAPDGHVARVSITSSQLRSRRVEKCIVNHARRFRFPRSSSGRATRFTTHFDFTND